MDCTKNPKRFLFWKYKGPHEEEIIGIRKFMWCSSDFVVSFRCKKCGAERERHFVEWDELLAYGKTNEEIEAVK